MPVTDPPPWLRRLGATILVVLAGTGAVRAESDAAPINLRAPQPVISIIIDDVGHRAGVGLRAVKLPGAIACAFLPYAPHTPRLALLAHSYNKEILLHAPMEAEGQDTLERGALTLHMTQQEFVRTLQDDLKAVPHVQGINNHMGSLLTRHPGHMLWLMQEINRHGDLFFVDSRTTTKSVALRVALESGVPSLQRDVFLDNDRDTAAIEHQFHRLLEVARAHGVALAIGHAYPETMEVLERMLPRLAEHGIRLVSLAEMIRIQQRLHWPWQTS